MGRLLICFMCQLSFCHSFKYSRLQTHFRLVSRKMSSFTTISHEKSVIYEEDIKKSKFIAIAKGASSFEEASSFLNDISDPKATHNCWAYRGVGYERCSDDGEPGGTAGRPILAAIEAEQLVNCMVVVIRHFGGIKLGTGGLSRAYHSVARECLKKSDRSVVKKRVLCAIIIPVVHVGQFYQCCQHFPSGVSKISEDFEKDAIHLQVQCDEDLYTIFVEKLTSMCKGDVKIETDDVAA